MIKKLLYIFLLISSFLLISCSNKDKTGNDAFKVDSSKGLSQFNKTSYVSLDSFDASSIDSNLKTAYLWISIKYDKMSSYPNSNNTTEPEYLLYTDVEGSGTDYSFSMPKGNQKFLEGTLKFSEDASTLTIEFTKNILMPTLEGKTFLCERK